MAPGALNWAENSVERWGNPWSSCRWVRRTEGAAAPVGRAPGRTAMAAAAFVAGPVRRPTVRGR